MKIFFIFICAAFISCSSNSYDKDTSENECVYTEECSRFFPFKDKIVDLELNKYVEAPEPEEVLYTDCSVYAHKFRKESYDTVGIAGKSFFVLCNDDSGVYQLKIIKDGKEYKTTDLPVDLPLEEVRDYDASLFEFGNELVVLVKDFYGKDFIVCKYDIEGNLLLKTRVEHTFITHPEPDTDYYHPYLYYFGKTDSQIVFSAGYFSEKIKTVILSVDDFSVEEYDRSVSGFILDEMESELIGFASYASDVFDVFLFDGREFEFELESSSEACDLILKGDKLYIANFHPIATGSSLHCYDLSKEELIWSADVKQVNASHSEYYNEVFLLTYKDKILMHGIESYGEYLQIFDAGTGARLAAFGDFFEID